MGISFDAHDGTEGKAVFVLRRGLVTIEATKHMWTHHQLKHVDDEDHWHDPHVDFAQYTLGYSGIGVEIHMMGSK